jgi:hypothetical protein
MSFDLELPNYDYILMDEITATEITQLIEMSGSFDWLNNREEDIHSLSDGDEVRWQM